MSDYATSSFAANISTGTWSSSTPETPPGSYTAFGQLMDVQLPNYDVKEIKATSLNQADRFDRFKPSFVNAGECQFTIHFAKANFNTVITDIAAGTEKWFKIEIPEPDDATHMSKFEFHGFWKSAPIEVPNSDSGDGITVKITVKVNGKPQFTAYS